MTCPRSGFTVVEVTVAVVIGALVVLLAHQVFSAVADRAGRLLIARRALDREANARRWLQATFLSIEVGMDSTGGFEGRADRVEFAAWQRTVDGWFERRRVRLGRTNDHLVATVVPGGSVVLADSLARLAFDYLLELGAEAHWVREWVSPVSAPLAVRMRVEKAGCGTRVRGCAVDTLLFLIKERG